VATPGVDTFESNMDVTRNLSLVVMPLSRAFAIQETPPENPYGQPPPPSAATALLKTSAAAWAESSELKDGVKIRKDAGEPAGPLTLAVQIDTNKQKPPTPPGMPEPPEMDEGPGVRIIAVGSRFMLTDNLALNMPGSNVDFVAQAVSWLAGGQAISIPEKKPPTLSLTFTNVQRALVSWTLVLIIPLATVIVGIVVWWRRR